MQLGKDLEGWHHSGPATCKNNSQVSAWLRFGTCGQRGKEEEQEHPAFPYVTFLDLSLSGWINPWAGPGDDGCSQPEECRGNDWSKGGAQKGPQDVRDISQGQVSSLGGWTSSLQESDQSEEKKEREVAL